MDRARVVAAELVGSAALVCAVVGSGIMADTLTADDAVALLANTVATAAALVALITVLGPVSGAHLNPVVTLVAAIVWRERRGVDALAAIAAQCAGGVLGVVVAHAMFALPFVQTSLKARAGPSQWLAEVVATAGLVVVIAGVRASRPAPRSEGRSGPGAAPFAVAAWITAAYWFTASTSFANPAVTLARSFTDTFAGIRPGDAPAFVTAQLAGGLGAALFARWLFSSPSTTRSA